MSRLVNEPIDKVRAPGNATGDAPGNAVGRAGGDTTLGAGVPAAFRWRGRFWLVIRACEVWKDTGSWWEGEGEKTFFRVEVAGGRLMEIYRDQATGRWFLYRVYD